jgi:apolipoprotein D and lipocalin family protein
MADRSVSRARSFSSTMSLLPTLLLAGTAGFLVGCATARPSGNRAVPEPAKPVDLTRYLGKWYEMARYEAGFEKDCEGATAEYALRPDGLVSVVNSCRQDAPDGPLRTARARARIVPDSGNAKLKVSFFGPFFIGNYWVMDHADDYGWTIVGEPTGKYLWILTRDPTPAQVVKDALVARVAALGYDTGMLRFTRQPPG